MNSIQKKIIKIASKILADYEYIYDPDHKKNPGGGFERTEKGWSDKGKLEKKREQKTFIYDEEYDKYLSIEDVEKEYNELKKSGETEAENFNDYLENITGKNGTCKIVKK